MKPPWETFPAYARGSLGWRMGDGEDYYNRFYRWFSALDAEASHQYRDTHAEPDGWEGFYRMLSEHPWRER
jgi:hypothetical protein